MAKKKGLSMDEKKKRMATIFAKTMQVYHYKEVEAFSLKAGISFGSIKDVLENVIADFLVTSEKIGTSKYYWSFASEKLRNIENQLHLQEKKNDVEKQKIADFEKKIQIEESKRIKNEERDDLLIKHKNLNTEHDKLFSELNSLQKYGSGVINKLKEEENHLKLEINHNIDIIFETINWIKEKQPGMDDKTINKMFDLPEELDYVE